MDFVKCSRCKRPILNRVRRCPGCGAPIDDARGARGGRGSGLAAAVLVASGVVLVGYWTGWTPTLSSVPAPEPPPTQAPAAKEDTRFSLNQSQRVDVYQKILLAQDHAKLEADRRYPPPDPSDSPERWRRHAEVREQFRKQMDEEDEKAIAKHYALTTEQLQAISAEGFQQNWPRPPQRSLR